MVSMHSKSATRFTFGVAYLHKHTPLSKRIADHKQLDLEDKVCRPDQGHS